MIKKIVFFFVIFSLCSFSLYVVACEKTAYKFIKNAGLYIVQVDLNKSIVVPYLSETLETVDVIAKKTGADVVINSGFFDAASKKTVSYILKNNKILANPEENENLTLNPEIAPYLDKIYNRGELRILKCRGEIKADIAFHSEDIVDGCELLNSTQAGPILLPDMDLEKEFFILKQDEKVVRDSIGVFRKTDRSLVAIKGDKLYLIITEENQPLTIYELREKLKKYNFDKALGLDGGGSVSLFAKGKTENFYQAREKNGASRPIKSSILIFSHQ